MMWPRKRSAARHRADCDHRLTHATNYREAAEKEHEEAMRRWREVDEVMAPMRRRAERNHFADLFPWLGSSGPSDDPR